MKYSVAFVLLFLGTTSFSCFSEPLSETKPIAKISYDDPRDPFEKFNRTMWEFNYQYLDRYLVRPVAYGYKDYVPNPMKSGIDNFVRNLDEPSSLVNNMLQGKWSSAANAGGRFVVNSTIGLAGLVDVANMMGLDRKQDDFSEVLAYYGAPNGPYFMVPFFGPHTSLELASDWVDGLYFPLSELTMLQSLVKWGLKSLNSRAEAIDQERLIDNSLDSYSFVKDAFYQHLDYKIYDGAVPIEHEDDDLLDEYLDELD